MAFAGAVFIGPELKGRDKWLGGELGGDGNIYGVSLESIIVNIIQRPFCPPAHSVNFQSVINTAFVLPKLIYFSAGSRKRKKCSQDRGSNRRSKLAG
jgi:hypothetical protein